jgi:hypothetical protein
VGFQFHKIFTTLNNEIQSHYWSAGEIKRSMGDESTGKSSTSRGRAVIRPFGLVFAGFRHLFDLVQSPITFEKTAALEQRMAALGIAEGDLLEKFVRGSGSGGQKINKTSSCVFLKHLPTGVCIKCQMDRSREMNRFLARRELCDQLDAIREGRAVAKTQAIEKMRRTNRPRSRNSKNRSVADKRNLSQKKSMRKPPAGD